MVRARLKFLALGQHVAYFRVTTDLADVVKKQVS